MRVLVYRPEPDAQETARALRDLGHEPVLASLLAVSSLPGTGPTRAPDAIVVTSANALRSLRTVEPDLAAAPLYAVGAKTAAAARARGFTDVHAGDGDAAGLAARIGAALAPGARVLFITGVDRKPDVEKALRHAGVQLDVMETYRVDAAVALPGDARKAIADKGVDGILHFSRRSAETFCALAIAAGLESEIKALPHYCLSDDVAEALRALGAARIHIAPQPAADSLLATLAAELTGEGQFAAAKASPIEERTQEASGMAKKEDGAAKGADPVAPASAFAIEPGPVTPNRDKRRKPTTIDLKPEAVETRPPEPSVSDAAGPPPEPPQPEVSPSKAKPRRSRLPAAIAILALLVVAAIAAGAFYLVYTHDAEVAALQARLDDVSGRLKTFAASGDLATLDKRVAALESSEPGRVQALAVRVDALEKHAIATLPSSGPSTSDPSIERRLDALESRADTLKQAADEASHKADAAKGDADKVMTAVTASRKNSPPVPILVAPSVDLTPIETRIDALETRVADIQRGLASAKSQARATEARAVLPSPASAAPLPGAGLAVVADTIRQALDAGLPYGPAVAALEGMGADGGAVAALKPMAAGAPTRGALKREFETLADPIVASMKPKPEKTESGSFLGRLMESATTIVSVEPVGQTAGAEDADVVTPIRAALGRNDFEGALAAWARLPGPGKAVSAAWAQKVKGRLQAEGAVSTLIADAIAALGKSKS